VSNALLQEHDPWQKQFTLVPISIGSHFWLIIIDTHGIKPCQEYAAERSKAPNVYVLDSMQWRSHGEASEWAAKWLTYWQILFYKIHNPLLPNFFYPNVKCEQDTLDTAFRTVNFIVTFANNPIGYSQLFQVNSP
jgi:hypothetical protein